MDINRVIYEQKNGVYLGYSLGNNNNNSAAYKHLNECAQASNF